MIFLPFKFIKFWYPDSFIVFFRAWNNIMMVLEEDMAVKLMLKLLFVRLFHDASPMGRILSFLFRTTRIIMGLGAYFIVSIALCCLGVFWFFLPGLFVIFLLLGMPVEVFYILAAIV